MKKFKNKKRLIAVVILILIASFLTPFLVFKLKVEVALILVPALVSVSIPTILLFPGLTGTDNDKR